MPNILRLLFFISVINAIAGCASLKNEKAKHKPVDNLTVIEPDVKRLNPVATTLISADLLLEDLALIKTHLLDVHPDPFARHVESDFEHQYQLIKSGLNYPLSRSEFYLRIAPLVASLKDIHSFINLPRDEFGDFSRKKEKLFPLAVILQGLTIYVAADLSDKPIVPIGAKLISINNAPIEFLVEVMKGLTAKETQTGQHRKVQMNFAWLLSAMGYGSEEYVVEYWWYGKKYQAQLAGLNVPKVKKTSGKPLTYYGYTSLTKATSLLWFNDFNEKPETFNAYLDDKFTQMNLAGVNNLIIDVRYNNGGLSENLKNLLGRLTDKQLSWAKEGKIKISQKLQKNHRRKTRKRRKAKYNWGLQLLPLEWADKLQHSIWWSSPGDVLSLELAPIDSNKGHRPDNIWVLTNGFCYSACSLFVANVNHYKLGKTVGERPGSLARSQFVYPVELKLPHSELKLTLPTMSIGFVETELQDLISPQKILLRSAKDIRARRDSMLNYVLMEAEKIKND